MPSQTLCGLLEANESRCEYPCELNESRPEFRCEPIEWRSDVRDCVERRHDTALLDIRGISAEVSLRSEERLLGDFSAMAACTIASDVPPSV
mmetsp:Transcript_0/g.6  ORF Transcript_0/g.6 Transcript_0/m.6 type:complete len:92 (-) Transcript_0:1076-1351(-)